MCLTGSRRTGSRQKVLEPGRPGNTFPRTLAKRVDALALFAAKAWARAWSSDHRALPFTFAAGVPSVRAPPVAGFALIVVIVPAPALFAVGVVATLPGAIPVGAVSLVDLRSPDLVVLLVSLFWVPAFASLLSFLLGFGSVIMMRLKVRQYAMSLSVVWRRAVEGDVDPLITKFDVLSSMFG